MNKFLILLFLLNIPFKFILKAEIVYVEVTARVQEIYINPNEPCNSISTFLFSHTSGL